MNAILEQINSAGYAFVEFAVPMLVQSSVLIAILLLVDLILRKKVRAVFRYCIWMLVLVKLVLPSSLSSPVSFGYWFGVELPSIKVTDKSAAVSPVNMSRIVEPASIEVSSEAPAVVEAASQPAVTSAAPVTWQGVVFLVWVAVVGVMGLLLLQRAIFVSGLVAQAKKPSSLMDDALKYCCRCIGIRGKVGLKVSANATSPAVCGLFRPVILVPENLGPSLGANGLRVVLIHELAHIKRGDLWVNLVQTVLQIIYFYNPMLWLANAMIRRVREQAVDETVQVVMGERARQYPETLVNVAKLAFKRPALSLRLIGVVESKSALKGRVRHMLNRPLPRSAKLGLVGLLAVIIIGAVLLPMAKGLAGPPEFVIKGTVTDAETGQPIAGAKVGDVERYAGGKQWTTTDANGNYSYKTWYEEHAVKCEIAGYETQIKGFLPKLFGLDLEKERVVDFALEPEQSSDRTDYSSVTVTEGVGFDEITFGCTGDFIKSRLGKPDKETKNEKDWWLNYSKTYGLGFWVNPQENFLIEIRLNKGFKGRLTSGISMSSTKQDVFDEYGEPIRQEVAEDFDERFDNQFLLFRKPFWPRKPRIAKIYYDEHGLLFWFDGDTLNQIVVYRTGSNQDCGEDKFKATLPNGVTVELVGVCEHPGEGKQWWRPDGSTLDLDLKIQKYKEYANEDRLAFVVGLNTNDFNLRYEIGGVSSYYHMDVYDSQGQKLNNCRAAVARLDDDRTVTKVRLGVATALWETIAEMSDYYGDRKVEGSRDIVFSAPIESKRGTAIAVRGEWGFEGERRIIAIDKDGDIHYGGWHGRSSWSKTIATTEFYDIAAEQIQKYKLQFRPYEWVTFKNVSLRPNFKTDVQVEVEGASNASLAAKRQ